MSVAAPIRVHVVVPERVWLVEHYGGASRVNDGPLAAYWSEADAKAHVERVVTEPVTWRHGYDGGEPLSMQFADRGNGSSTDWKVRWMAVR